MAANYRHSEWSARVEVTFRGWPERVAHPDCVRNPIKAATEPASGSAQGASSADFVPSVRGRLLGPLFGSIGSNGCERE